MLPFAVLASTYQLRDLLLASLPAGAALCFTDEVFPGAELAGAVLVVDAEHGLDRLAHLPLRNARRCGVTRAALLLAHRPETAAEVLLLAEDEARRALEREGFDGAAAPLARAAYDGLGIYARLRSLDELFLLLAAASPQSTAATAAPRRPSPPAASFAAASLPAVATATDEASPSGTASASPASPPRDPLDELLDALWPCARQSTLLHRVPASEAASAAADAIFALAPVAPCCGAPVLRRMLVDLRAMRPAAPAELGAFALYDCHLAHRCPVTSGDYLIRHVPRAALPPSAFAAITYPYRYGDPLAPTVLAVDHPRWMCPQPESLEDYWSPDPRGAALTAALRPWMHHIARAPLYPTPDPLDEELALGESLEAALDALALDVPIGERSGGPLLVQSGGWIPRCSLCAREEHVVFQTQAFTGDNTTILVACPAHPDTASIIVLRL